VFVLCTAQSENSVGSYKDYGFDEFIEKPIEKTKLERIYKKAFI
jgi:hypothetical protein